MECNKEEAVKAMQLSEKKMQSKDYTGAMKMAQKAQRLFPALENISRLLTVCEVLCTAENKIGGSEMDWYRILQIQQFDSDDTISKHYKKLALLLHPDKNKFSGSDAAFKWIVEAKNVLLDKQKRTLYDIKYISLVRHGAPKTTAHPAAAPKTTAHPAAAPKTTAHPAAAPKTTAHPAAAPKTTAHPAAAPKTTAHPAAAPKTTAHPAAAPKTTAHPAAAPKTTAHPAAVPKTTAHPAATPKTTAHPAATPKTTAHPAATTNSQKNPQSQWGSNTFCTECYFCLAKFQYYRFFLNRILCCQNCHKAFEARELQIYPESSRSIFSNHKEIQTNGGTEIRNFTRFQNGDAAAKPALKVVGNFTDLSKACQAEKKDIKHEVELEKQGVGTCKPSLLKSEDVENSSNINKEREKTTSELGEGLTTDNRATADTDHAVKVKVELSAGHHHRRSPRSKHGLSSLLNDKDDDDFVSPPLKRLRKGGLSSAAEKTENDATGDGNKQPSREKLSFPVEVNLSNKKIKVEEFELKVKGATMSDNDRSNFTADVSPVANVTAASTSGPMELPDPQFHKFSLDGDSLSSLVKADQIWAVFEEIDSMPRWYAYVKKVLKRDKVKIIWLEPIPYDQSVIDWCDKELPVGCGKFKLGKSDEIKDHLVLSHQMNYTKGIGRNSFLIYPRKGETWAVYQNWDIGWTSEPEKHTPFKYDFVEVLTDFVEGDGVGVCKLGKVRGFVSLFQQTEQQGIHMFKVAPHELYRFSHRIHSFKMTGCEAHGVPTGCFELDPASLPASIFDSSDLGVSEMDDRSKKTEADAPSKKELKQNKGHSEKRTRPLTPKARIIPLDQMPSLIQSPVKEVMQQVSLHVSKKRRTV